MAKLLDMADSSRKEYLDFVKTNPGNEALRLKELETLIPEPLPEYTGEHTTEQASHPVAHRVVTITVANEEELELLHKHFYIRKTVTGNTIKQTSKLMALVKALENGVIEYDQDSGHCVAKTRSDNPRRTRTK